MKKRTRPTAPPSKWPYPFVECSGHPGKQRGYVLCPHVILGQCRPISIELATDTDLGSCLCGQPGCNPRDGKIVCEQCVIHLGLLITA